MPSFPHMNGDPAQWPGAAVSQEDQHIVKHFKSLFGGVFGSSKGPAYPVINGATEPARTTVRGIISELASQSDRWTSDWRLLASLADTELLDGGEVDDKDYQMEMVVQLANSLPKGPARDKVGHAFIKLLWNNLQHPPLSVLGPEYRYRMADGSNNNIKYPQLGQAGSRYARTVMPKTLQPGVKPDPDVLFDSIFARDTTVKEHPTKTSSMLFYLASIIIHDVFHTDPRDSSRAKTSSYLDLAPLYGSSQDEQNAIRTFKLGLIKPDTFSESRLLGFPPGVCALLVCFSRYHNYVALQLKRINENGRFTGGESEDAEKQLDEDLFQTARLITCGLYVNIIITDYVRTILNLNRTNSSWTLDPRDNFGDVYNSEGTPAGKGNQVSCEFNLIYRWHSTMSKKDEQWTEDLFRTLTGKKDITKLTEAELMAAMHEFFRSVGKDPSKWSIDNGKYQRTASGAFRDEDLANILADSTDDVASAFGPRQVPVVMKLIEVMGIKQARAWNVATLNEFRKFFRLQPHKTFKDITSDEEVAHALEALYQHPDYVELYPGLIAEDAKSPVAPGSGLCPGFTVSRTILADAVSLVRGDRFYTVDFSPATLTNWGHNQIKSDPEVAQGGCFYNVVMRALPNWYRGNSVYAMFPFTVPSETRSILRNLGREHDLIYDRPSLVPIPTAVKSFKAVTSILENQQDFKVVWGDHIHFLTGHKYMLSGDKQWNTDSKQELMVNLYKRCPVDGLGMIRKFYEALTTQLIEIRSQRLRGDWYQLDACRDVGNPSHAIFVAQMFQIPLIAPDAILPGVEVDSLYLAMAVLFAYVFLDFDTARSFKLRQSAKKAADKISKLVKAVCFAIKAGHKTGVTKVMGALGEHSDEILGEYGKRLILSMYDGDKSDDEVVWNVMPTAAAAVATQAQHFGQMLDLYLSDKYNHHWPDIQKCAASDTDEDFEKLKSYALEANRLVPAAWGLLRRAAVDIDVVDGDKTVHIKNKEQIYTDFVSAGLDPSVFPDPELIKLDRNRENYIHHGWGPHACAGRQIVEIAMAAQLKIFARLRNLRRAPGPQGEMKRTIPLPNPVSSDPKPNPGHTTTYIKEDWSDWWPFPTTLKVHHDGFFVSQESSWGEDTGLPGAQEALIKARMENQDANGLGPGIVSLEVPEESRSRRSSVSSVSHHSVSQELLNLVQRSEVAQ